MNRSSVRGIVLSIIVFSTACALTPNVFAEIDAKSIALEETTILEFTNKGPTDVSYFRIWLDDDYNFKSFKAENGWSGEKLPQGVIVFTSVEAVKPGDSIKFGIKTDKASSGVNWKALDKDQNEIEVGIALAEDISNIQNIKKDVTSSGVFTDSVFRIVPEKPSVGGSIRVTGDGFGTLQEFDFFVDSRAIGSFVTDESGHFMTTMKIPENIDADRVELIVKDKKGEEKKISLRLKDVENRIVVQDNVKLTIKGVPDVMHRGDLLDISGTGNPGGAVTAKIHDIDGNIINTRTAEIDSKGNWKLDEPILVPLDTPLGKYSAEISDGREKILRDWTVESSKVIIIDPESLKVEPGDPIRFNGTALPNVPIELVLEDPLGDEKLSDIVEVDDTGLVKIEYPTIANVDKEGTWTLIATQGKYKEFIYAGLGQVPTIPVNFEFDKLNYKATETAQISFRGKPSESLSLLIIDPADKPKDESILIKLEPDGRGTYQLDLDGYSSGVYTAVISKGATKSSEIFTVGLQPGSGKIDINTTKIEYQPGDPILILGETNPNVLLKVGLYNPQGNEVKIRETFSDKNGKISEDGFRIPSKAQPGTWQLKAVSGSNFDIVNIEVTAIHLEGMIVSVTDGIVIPGVAKTITIKVIGAKGTVQIEIITENEEVIDKLEFPASKQGEINQPWIVKNDMVPGTYTIKAKDAYNSAETKYLLK